jgi:mitochondrial fission protein ELM1
MRRKHFELIVMPEHDLKRGNEQSPRLAVTHVAPNLISPAYIEEQSQKFLNRYSHLKTRTRYKIGVLIGGPSKKLFISENQIKALIHQLKDVAQSIPADILLTTSRRTPETIENHLYRAFKKDPSCPLMISANREDVPEAVGGILALSNILIVSGDSISMVSEAISSGKPTIVFVPERKNKLDHKKIKHELFVERLHAQGYVLISSVNTLGQTIYDVVKNKLHTKAIDDDGILLEAARVVI